MAWGRHPEGHGAVTRNQRQREQGADRTAQWIVLRVAVSGATGGVSVAGVSHLQRSAVLGFHQSTQRTERLLFAGRSAFCADRFVFWRA